MASSSPSSAADEELKKHEPLLEQGSSTSGSSNPEKSIWCAMFPGIDPCTLPPQWDNEVGQCLSYNASSMGHRALVSGLDLSKAPRSASLKSIMLPYNEFSGAFSGFVDCPPGLEHLGLRSCSLKTDRGINLADFPVTIRSIGLSFNPDIGGPLQLGGAPHLTTLQLEGLSKLTGTISFKDFPRTLQKLDLVGCCGLKAQLFVREIPEAMEELLLSECTLMTGALWQPDWDFIQQSRKSLVWLHIDGTHIEASLPAAGELTERMDWSFKSNISDEKNNGMCPCCALQ